MSFLDRVKNSIHQTYVKGAEKIMPTLKDSKFLDEGVLTPEEFVAAGDLLVHKCPTWTWAAADDGKRSDYLPKDKQFLLTRNVPCMQRVKAFEGQVASSRTDTITTEDGDWCAPTFDAVDSRASGDDNTAAPAVASNAAGGNTNNDNNNTSANADDDGDDDDSSDIPDMETFDEEGLGEADDDNALLPAVNSNIVSTRTYDIAIAYDKYYQTPRLWLFGYDEARAPLKPEQVFEDVSLDHAQKTVTIETHPHLASSWACIHPCRHAAVMKQLVERMGASGKEARVDQYLFLFLKFINSAIPTIEYDYTHAIEAGEAI
eukprot:TRINITY_DN130_c0_g1_i1.p1 TRINITY_DN130_c0_g1~~TRINITY_DN130_c0_g1_i1.p1  ORF type:complete len:317 (-),score=111.90 TRINITY_DN130_c0_g1_i1:33-983(-)